MANNNKELAAYVTEQLADLGEVRSIPMMGGYVFYYRERIFGGIYGESDKGQPAVYARQRTGAAL